MTKHYYPDWPKLIGFYTRVCYYCREVYYVDEVFPFEATHDPLDCIKLPKENPMPETLTTTQTEALRTIQYMATCYAAENAKQLTDAYIEIADDAIEVAGKLIEDLNSGRVKLVNLQE